MHLNVVIQDTSSLRSRYNDGVNGVNYTVSGAAKGKPAEKSAPRSRKYIIISPQVFEAMTKETLETVVHEYAHVFFFSKPKQFREAFINLYNEVKNVSYKNVADWRQNPKNGNSPIANPPIVNQGNNKAKLRDGVLKTYRNILQYYSAAIPARYSANQTINGMYQIIHNFMTMVVKSFTKENKWGADEINQKSQALAESYYKSLQKLFPTFQFKTPPEIASCDINLIRRFFMKLGEYSDDLEDVIVDMVSAQHIQKSDNTADPGTQKFLQTLNNWPTSQGLANYDEMFATAIEHFWKLPLDIKKRFVHLMMTS